VTFMRVGSGGAFSTDRGKRAAVPLQPHSKVRTLVH